MNYIVDPYSVTQYNLLGIPTKLVSDDRSEKIVKIENATKFDNILLGSSRVYLMNPFVLSKYAGGVSYNLGVGTAQVEDHLGFLLYLERLNKFPKLIILGLDFYSFNENLETNKYFVRNKKLNFINQGGANPAYLSNFVSLDTTGASIKTLKTFIGVNQRKQRFDDHGGSGEASTIFDYFPEDKEIIDIYTLARKGKASDFIKYPLYKRLSKKRLEHMRRIVELTKRHGSQLKVFITPLFGKLLEDIDNDELVSTRLVEFKSELIKITGYYDFLTHNEVSASSVYFGDPSHLKHATGNLILARLFDDKEVNIPEGFGIFREQKQNSLSAN